MPADWGRDGPDLMIALNRTGMPLALQIQEQLRVAIREGRLLVGERLPSTRRLADQLGVSRGTVVEVYEQLVAEGYVDSAVGSGTRVARIPVVERRDRAQAPPAAAARPKFAIDFEYGIPDLGSVPLRDWVWALGEAARTLPTAGLGDEEPAGSRHLRDVLTAYHRRVRAGCATADDAVVVGGFRQGLAFTLATLARSGIEVLALGEPQLDQDRCSLVTGSWHAGPRLRRLRRLPASPVGTSLCAHEGQEDGPVSTAFGEARTLRPDGRRRRARCPARAARRRHPLPRAACRRLARTDGPVREATG